jgi:predicted transcriptional regulator
LRRSERKRAADFNWKNHICILSKEEDNFSMSSRETVIELVSRMPENTSLTEIAREIELFAGIQEGRRQARRGEGIPAEDVCKLVDAWASK